jgi:transposase
MGTRKTTPKAEARAKALHRAGRSLREIEATLRAEGLRGSRSTVQTWLAAKKPKRATSSPTSARRTTPAATASVLELLRRNVTAIERLARVAEREGRLSEFSTLTRTLNQCVSLIARHTPPEPPDPGASPDMLELGAQVASRLRRLIDDAHRRGASA